MDRRSRCEIDHLIETHFSDERVFEVVYHLLVMTQPVVFNEEGESFTERASAVLTPFLRAMKEVVDAVEHLDGLRPIDLSRGLGLDMKLAWKVSHLVTSASPFDAVRHIPGLGGIQIVGEAARERGAPVAGVERLQASYSALRRFISDAAGSRRNFESMVAGIEQSRDRRLEQEQRRQLFEGASAIWGVQCQTLYRLDLLFPSSIPDLLDCVTLRTMGEVRRLRGGVPIPFPRAQNVDDDGQAVPNVKEEPIDPAIQSGKFPVVGELCHGDVPVFEPRRSVSRRRVDEAAAIDTGDPAPFTLTIGEVLRAVQPDQVSQGTHGIFQLMRLRMPAVRVAFDVAVHRDLIDESASPDVSFTSDLHGAATEVIDIQRVRISLTPEVQTFTPRASRSLAGVGSLGRHYELALQASGCARDDFRWFRIELGYPPISTTLCFASELPRMG